MKELKNLAYALKRSGFEKQATRVYSLIKTADNFADMFKDSTPVGEDSKSQNLKTEEFDAKIQNSSPWSNQKGTTKPAKMGPQAEKKIEENPAKYTNAVNNLKQIHPTSAKLHQIKFDGLSDEESNRRAFGSIAKMLKDTASLDNKNVPVQEVDDFATHINDLKPVQPAAPVSQLTSDSSFGEFESNAKELDFGGQSEAIKEVFAQAFNKDLNEIKIDQFIPETETFESGSIYDEDGRLKSKFSPASVSITAYAGDQAINNLFDGYIYGLWFGTRTLARLSTGSASSLIYAGTISVKRGLTDGELKEYGEAYKTKFESAAERLTQSNPDLAQAYRTKANAAQLIANGAEPVPGSAEEAEYNKIMENLNESTGKPYPIFFTNHKITPTLATVNIKNLNSDNVNGKIDLRTGKPTDNTAMDGGTESNLAAPIALIIYSEMAVGKSFSGITRRKLRGAEDKNIREEGGIFDISQKKDESGRVLESGKASGFEATISKAIKQVETVFAQGGAGSRFSINPNIIANVLRRLNRYYMKEDDSYPGINIYSIIRKNVENQNAGDIIKQLFDGAKQGYIQRGGPFGIGQKLGPLTHDGERPIFNLAKIEITDKTESIRIFNTILLSEGGAKNHINERFIHYLDKYHNKANFQPVNVAIGQAMRLTLLFHASKKLLDLRPFEPLREAILGYIEGYMKDAVNMTSEYVTQYKPEKVSRPKDQRGMREQLEQ